MSQVIALDSIKKVGEQVAAPAGGCEAKSCGSEQGPDDLAPEIWEKVKDHPCYSEQAHHYFARMHVAVAPACNIQCNYCNRKYDCANESRPGVVSQKLTPDQALRKVLAVATEIPQMSVVGVAGPGDALANPHKTFPFFQELKEKAPDIRQCLSTNGLALPDYVDEIAELGVDHVTITMNAIDPEVGAKIYPWIFYDHKRWHGVEAAKILLERQLQGLEMLVARGILVKINSVMIPGINDRHLIEVNKAVKARGAFLHNIMPLISDPAHGTHFGLTGQRGPTAKELEALRDACEGGARMMRHCRQCRADAVGLLGEDRGAEFTLDKLPEEPEYDPAVRAAYRAHIEVEQAQRQVTRASGPAEGPVHKVAIATKGGERINQHFGHAKEFLVYEVSEKGVRFLSHRPVPQYCQGGHGDDDAFANVIEAIADVDAVLVAKIGGGPAKRLAEAGIAAVDTHAFDYIEESVLAWYAARTAEDGSAVA